MFQKILLMAVAALLATSHVNAQIMKAADLEQYAKETGEKVPVLDDFLAKQEFGEYAIRIHSVKSTSKMIGAEALSEEARKLEMAAKEGRGEYIEEAHAGVMKEILRITEGIRQLL